MKTYQDFGIDIPQEATGQITTTCPECSDKRKKKNDKCLSVNADDGVWNCHHCQWSGSLHTRIPKPIFTKPAWKEESGFPEEVAKYFSDRGISEVTLKRNDIQYKKNVFGKNGAICFPFKRNGETVNVKYRSADKQFRQEKGAEKILYGLDGISGGTLIICEGEMDKLSFDEVGYSFVVSVPDGAPAPGTQNYDSKFSFLENCRKELSEVDEFIIAVDNDPAGQTLEKELARRLGAEKCQRVTYPKGCKDANDVLIKHGKSALKAIIGTAKPFPIAGIITASDMSEPLYEMYQHGTGTLFSTGWKELDEHYKIKTGEMNIVTGFPGHGKSEFLDALLLNLSKKNGWKFGMCSLENLPYTRHIAKFAQKIVGKPFFDGYTARMTKEELSSAEKYIDEHFYFIAPEVVTIDNILDLAKKLIYREGIRGLVIDPYNMISNVRPSGVSETEYIAQFLAKIRLFARNNDIAVWVVAHPTKIDKEHKNKPPTVFDIAGSAHWSNMADNAFSVFRKKESGNVVIDIQKIRFQEVGKVGSINMTYDPPAGKYEIDHVGVYS
jgi:twinkle protein